MLKKMMLASVIATSAIAWGADWLTDGGDNQRTAWQRDEKILTKDNVKNMKLAYAVALGVPLAPSA